MDQRDGVYAAATLRLSAKHFPLYLENILSQELRTAIPSDAKLIWNVSLVYGLRREFRRLVRPL